MCVFPSTKVAHSGAAMYKVSLYAPSSNVNARTVLAVTSPLLTQTAIFAGKSPLTIIYKSPASLPESRIVYEYTVFVGVWNS